MMILENPALAHLGCILSIFAGLAIRLWIWKRQFDRRSFAGAQLFRSYYRQLLILFFESILMVISTVLIAGGALVFLCT